VLALPRREIGCWCVSTHSLHIVNFSKSHLFFYRPWDVCAGIVIAEEAGGVVTGSHAAFSAGTADGSFGDVTEEILSGRKYVVVRAIADTPVRAFPCT
jgi:hypothetical protein